MRGTVITWGGYDGRNNLDDMWEWNGSDWLQRTPPTSPPARADSWIVYDSLRHRSVMFGLSRSSVDLWEYGTSAPATWSSFGSGCSGTNALVPALSSAAGPWLGESFELRLSFLPTTATAATVLLGLSNTTWNSIPLPFPLASLGMTGCELLVEPTIQLPIAPSGGAGSLILGVPNEARLLGAHFFAQALVADAGANAAGVILSNGGESQFGAK